MRSTKARSRPRSWPRRWVSTRGRWDVSFAFYPRMECSSTRPDDTSTRLHHDCCGLTTRSRSELSCG